MQARSIGSRVTWGEERMKSTMVAVTLVAGTLLISAPSLLFAQDLGPLTPREQRAFNACVFKAWVNDYCRFHAAWQIWDRPLAFRTCVIANGGRPEDVEGGFTQSGESIGIRDNCWREAQSGHR